MFNFRITMPRSFHRKLRLGEAEQVKNNASQFDLLIKIQQLEKNLQEAQRVRRRSLRTLPVEQFYYGDENSAASTPVSTPFQVNSSQKVLSGKRTSRASSTRPIEVPNGRRNENENMPPSFDVWTRMFDEELSEAFHQKERLERQLTEQIVKVSNLESHVAELKTAAVSVNESHRQERGHLDSIQRDLEGTVSIKARAHEQELVMRQAAQHRASLAESKVSEISVEFEKATHQLALERLRMNVWEVARQKELGIPHGSAISKDNVNALLHAMKQQRLHLDGAEYSRDWRDAVVFNMNLAMRILYACEQEVVGRRLAFIQRYSATSGMDLK